MNWIQRFLTAIATHKADAAAHHAKTSKASEITSEQFLLARMPRGTLGHVITGQGVGANPVYAAPAGGPTVIRKTADETVNDSDVLQNDDHLFFAIAANEEWIVDMTLFLWNDSAWDFKWTFVFPVAADVKFGEDLVGVNAGDVVTAGVGKKVSGQTTVMGHAGNPVVYCQHLWVLNGINAGSVQLQWAQDTAFAGNLKVLKGSYLRRKQ